MKSFYRTYEGLKQAEMARRGVMVKEFLSYL